MSHSTVLDRTFYNMPKKLTENKKKLIITDYQSGLLTALSENGEIVELEYEDGSRKSLLGNIYVGRVEQVVKNISAAFISFARDKVGYYSIHDNKNPVFLNPKKNDIPVPGDLILVQVARDPIRTKETALTSDFSLTGRYAVLTVGNNQLSVSGKITDETWKDWCRSCFREYCTQEYGFIIRTNAYGAPPESIEAELAGLAGKYQALRKNALYQSAHTLVCEAPPSYLKNLRDVYDEAMAEIITDEPSVYQSLAEYWKDEPALLGKLVLYQDSMLPLKNLYSLHSVMEHALRKKVWLKSGANLVIEPTEALTAIDVNTGKYSGKKDVEETRLAINKEAAKEIAKQLRLRNLSGIIIVDFINMDSRQAVEELMGYFSAQLKRDPVRTCLAGMTNLGLAEVTRKKGKKPLMEQLTPVPQER